MSTVVCLASGPSLCAEDVAFCRGKALVIAIKDVIRLAPWADVLYACDAKWWKRYGDGLVSFQGQRFTLDHFAARWATVLTNTGQTGLETDPGGLRTGLNSGYQAINLAVHLGATRIVLLGYDMQADGKRDHFFGAHPWKTKPPYQLFLPLFQTLIEPLRALGIQVVNATRRTALTCFPCVSLAEALA